MTGEIGSVYAQAVDFPIGLAKSGGVVVDIVLTRVDTTPRWCPHIASPITTEGQVEDYLMRVKELVVIAIVRVYREARVRWTPSVKGVSNERFSVPCSPQGYLWWGVKAVSRPEPDLNAAISRFQHDVVSTTIEVKRGAVGGDICGELDATPLVEISVSIAVVTKGVSRLPPSIGGHCTTRRSVQSRLVLRVQIDTFDDVDFTADRPWTLFAQSPKGRPGGATGRHVCQV